MMDKTQRIRKKRRGMPHGHKGFSMAETMVALIIVSLLSMGIATGVAFGARQYKKSVTLSESKILCSTLSSVIRNELVNATKVYPGTPTAFDSKNYTISGSNGKRCFVMQTGEDESVTYSDGSSTFGLIYVADQGSFDNPLELIPAAAYSSYRLKANVSVAYHEKTTTVDEHFAVTVKIKDDAGDEQAEAQFIVIPLNKLEKLT